VIVDIATPKDKWTRLGDGYRVETAFVLWEGDSILQIPSSALFRDGDSWALYVVIDGRAQFRSVRPGQRSGIVTEILSGIDVGEIIINHPGDNLDDGSRVRSR